MGLLDNLQKTAKDMAPIAKELASEAGRTAKAVGETIKEEQPVKKAAAGAAAAVVAPVSGAACCAWTESVSCAPPAWLPPLLHDVIAARAAMVRVKMVFFIVRVFLWG